MRELIKVIKALSEPIRIRIIKMLEKKSMCVCELTSVLKIQQSSVSHHLKILKDAGLVDSIRNGQWIDYKLSKEKYNKYAPEFLDLISGFLNNDKKVMKDLSSAEKADRKDICCSCKISNRRR